MSSYISTAKSPCASHPDHGGLKCPNIKQDKNLEPCCSCKLPSQYDDKICKGPKKFHDYRPGKTGNQYDGSDDDLCYTTIGDVIEAMVDLGMSHQQIADSIDCSRPTVSRKMKGRK